MSGWNSRKNNKPMLPVLYHCPCRAGELGRLCCSPSSAVPALALAAPGKTLVLCATQQTQGRDNSCLQGFETRQRRGHKKSPGHSSVSQAWEDCRSRVNEKLGKEGMETGDKERTGEGSGGIFPGRSWSCNHVVVKRYKLASSKPNQWLQPWWEATLKN